MADYLLTANSIYIKLEEFEDSFQDEAELINKAKCELLNNNELNDLSLSKGIAMVREDNGNYEVYYNGLTFYLEVEDKMIIDYMIE